MATDIVIQVRTLQEVNALDAVVRSLRRRWPRSVAEGPEGERYRFYRDIPFDQLAEVFVYVDEPSRAVWRDLGAVPETEGTMVHALVLGDALTLVVDQGPEMNYFIEEMRGLLAPTTVTS